MTWGVVGGDLVTLKAGPKKWREAHWSRDPANPWSFARLMVNRIPKVGENG